MDIHLTALLVFTRWPGFWRITIWQHWFEMLGNDSPENWMVWWCLVHCLGQTWPVFTSAWDGFDQFQWWADGLGRENPLIKGHPESWNPDQSQSNWDWGRWLYLSRTLDSSGEVSEAFIKCVRIKPLHVHISNTFKENIQASQWARLQEIKDGGLLVKSPNIPELAMGV